MKLRKLGRNGPQVSAIGLGCMGFSEFYASDAATESDAIAVIHDALARGLTFLDTADAYGPYSNEILVGRAIAGRRGEVFLATKFGIQRDPANPRKRAISGKPDYVRSSCEGSLKRLNVDRIDLYYQHRVDRDTPIEETVGAMAELVKAGKIGGIGLSEPSATTIRKAHNVHPITAVQTEYSLWSREPEDGVLQTCEELGIGFVPYSPLGRGFLTGRYRSIEDLDAELDAARRDGWAAVREELEVGLNAVAAPIRDNSSAIVAALSVSGPTYRMDSAQFTTVSRMAIDAAAQISRRLGHTG